MSKNEYELRTIWGKALNLSNADHSIIKHDTNFFEIGGTSLMIGIMNIMCTQSFGKTVSPEFFYEEPTFGKMLSELSLAED